MKKYENSIAETIFYLASHFLRKPRNLKVSNQIKILRVMYYLIQTWIFHNLSIETNKYIFFLIFIYNVVN